jgi:hypothetical protein
MFHDLQRGQSLIVACSTYIEKYEMLRDVSFDTHETSLLLQRLDSCCRSSNKQNVFEDIVYNRFWI